jgi:hypothetical protein
MFTILSLLDDRARPKGSRDPLGAEACWSHLGRRLVGNLTTVTSNLDNFMVALLCCRFAHEDQDDTNEARVRYLRAEQVAAYLKLAAGGTPSFLGVTRAKKNFSGNGTIVLGNSPKAQLLASQAGYGLWGLYSSALESVGLITGEHRKLTATGNELAEAFIAQLGAEGWNAFCRLASAETLDRKRTEKLAPQFVATLADTALRTMAVSALLSSQRDCALQAQLFPLAQTYLAQGGDVNGKTFCAWLLAGNGASEELQVVMRRIQSLDPLLKLADVVWLWLQGQDGLSVGELTALLEHGLKELAFDDSWQAEARLPHRAFLLDLQVAASQGDAAAVLRILLDQNRKLMRARGGAPWIEIDGQQTLAVRIGNDQPRLGNLRDTGTSWYFTYFLHSFLSIANQGRA